HRQYRMPRSQNVLRLGQNRSLGPTGPDTRVLRYQLAALTRSEIEGRGAAGPTFPVSTIAHDRSAQARRARSENLAALWRAGPSVALFAEAELAPTLDLFANAERAREGVIGEAQLTAELAALHGKLGDRIEAGERPSLPIGLEVDAGARSPAIEGDEHRLGVNLVGRSGLRWREP
ncbi:hypothetical protein PX699_27680, partial [Sphingobium sp. H39-3-25]|nr:hypothetical protein [Sphingobium arseniciresistens]